MSLDQNFLNFDVNLDGCIGSLETDLMIFSKCKLRSKHKVAKQLAIQTLKNAILNLKMAQAILNNDT